MVAPKNVGNKQSGGKFRTLPNRGVPPHAAPRKAGASVTPHNPAQSRVSSFPYRKHPRTNHLPWSESVQSDDGTLAGVEQFEGRLVVVTEKRDGECTSLYGDGIVHARSIDGRGHPWQDVVKAEWAGKAHELPSGWRVVGENLRAQHSITYDGLRQWVEVFAVFDETNTALGWEETVEVCDMLGLVTVPYCGERKGVFVWDERYVRSLGGGLDTSATEGYVVRVADPVPYQRWGDLVGKWVRRDHVQTADHWSHTWQPNRLRPGG